ncbi:MAG: iron ABC transporter permease [Chloroflexi bacterium]|nr:iron ABC transporter permease [Chloroflexota bacterium]
MSLPLPVAKPWRRSASARALLWWAAPLLFLAVFFFQPLVAILRLAVEAALSSGAVSADLWLRIWRPLRFTFWQAGLSTVLTLVVGLPAAYLFARFRFPGKGLLRVLTTLPFILPTVVVAAGFNALIGPRGWVNVMLMQALGLSEPPLQLMNSLAAILLAHVFYNTTIIIRVVSNAWAQLDPRLEQAARVLGASPLRAWREVTLPLLRPAILAATLLVFLFDFTSFGVILLLGGPKFATLEVEIYIQTLQMLNLPLAGLLSAIQMACTLALTVAYSRLGRGQSVPLSPRLRGEGERAPKSWRERLLLGLVLILVFVLLVSPLAALGLRSVTKLEANRGERGEVSTGFTLDYYRELFINRRQSIFYVPPVAAVRNSLQYAAATVAISVFLGILAASALNRPARLNRWLDPLLMLPLGTSAVTLGLGYVVVFNRPPLDVRSFPFLIPIAHSLVALPFVVRTLQPALASIPDRLRQAAAVLGASPWQVWREVDLPIVARAVLVSAIFAFTISLGEFGATTFLARPEYPTMPVAIYRFISQPGALNYGQALAMATLLMLVCALSILVLERLRLPSASDF